MEDKGLASSTLAELMGETRYRGTQSAWASVPDRVVDASGNSQAPACCLAHS